MPFRLVAAFDLVLVAFIYVGSVNRPAAKAKAEQRPSRDVLGTVSSDAAINAVSDGVVVGAPDVDDPSRAPSTPGHQVRRTFAYFGGWFGACWLLVYLSAVRPGVASVRPAASRAARSLASLA